MKYEDFEDSVSGILINTINGQRAFLPHPLPPTDLKIESVVTLLTQAARKVAELDVLSQNSIINAHLLTHPLKRAEAVSSSRMEGTITSVSDLLRFDIEGDKKDLRPDTKEVSNYIRALDYAITYVQNSENNATTGLIDKTLIKHIHALLLKDITQKHRGADIEPGKIREEQNFIGRTLNIADARFIPPPPTKVEECLNDLENYMTDRIRHDIDPLIKAALIHYQFETIHPFPDGNGRVGRVLIPLLFIKHGLIKEPVLYLSNFFEQHQKIYVDHLYNISAKNDWIAWIDFFLRAVISQSEGMSNKIRKLSDLHDSYTRRFDHGRASAKTLSLINTIFEYPIITIPFAMDQIGLKYPATKNNVEKLIEVGVLQEYPTHTHPQKYWAKEVFDIIFENEKI